MSSIKDQIRQEIEFLKDLNEGLYTEGDNSYYEGEDNAYNHILAFIDSLPEDHFRDSTKMVSKEQEEEIPPYCTGIKGDPDPSGTSDLEKEVKQYWNDHALEYRLGRVADLDFLFLCARHFAQWGAKHKESLQVQETCKENPDSFTDKPKEMSVDEAMAYLEEKIAKASKSWEGVDVDKFLDEIRGREPNDLEEAAKDYAILPMDVGDGLVCTDKKKERAFIAGAKWMKSQMPMPEDTVIFQKGVAEGRRLEREDRNDDKLPRYYGD